MPRQTLPTLTFAQDLHRAPSNEPAREREVVIRQYLEQGLNLSESWHKATLARTIPRSVLSRLQRIDPSQYFDLRSASPSSHIAAKREYLPCYDLDWPKRNEPACIVCAFLLGKQTSPLFSMDSGLEAFSLNPTHGNVAALTFQSTALSIM